MKKQGVVVQACDYKAGEAETGGPWNSLARQPFTPISPRSEGETLFQNQNGWLVRNGTQGSPLASTGTPYIDTHAGGEVGREENMVRGSGGGNRSRYFTFT